MTTDHLSDAESAILELTHRMDDAAHGITENEVYDFATAIRVQLGLDGEAVAADARAVLAAQAARVREVPAGYSLDEIFSACIAAEVSDGQQESIRLALAATPSPESTIRDAASDALDAARYRHLRRRVIRPGKRLHGIYVIAYHKDEDAHNLLHNELLDAAVDRDITDAALRDASPAEPGETA